MIEDFSLAEQNWESDFAVPFPRGIGFVDSLVEGTMADLTRMVPPQFLKWIRRPVSLGLCPEA